MKGETDRPMAFDPGAVVAGMVWGLVLMLFGGIAQGLFGFGRPLSAGAENVLTWVWQVAGPLLAGFLAARRAAGSGWLHGAVSGAAVVLSLAAVMGVHSALPTLAALLKLAGIGTGAGALGGIAGVNAGGR